MAKIGFRSALEHLPERLGMDGSDTILSQVFGKTIKVKIVQVNWVVGGECHCWIEHIQLADQFAAEYSTRFASGWGSGSLAAWTDGRHGTRW